MTTFDDGDGGNNSFASFMTSKSENAENKSSSIFGENKTKKSLAENKQKAEEEKNKELDEAKKKANATTNRYRAGLVQAQGREFIRALPFIIFGIFIIVMLIVKGGDWLQFILSGLMKSLTGSK
jgi:hypothetical protein